MGTQAQALRAYYASMSDAKLLETARNRKSFIEPARAALAEELARRNLPEPEEPHRAAGHSALAAWFRKLRHAA